MKITKFEPQEKGINIRHRKEKNFVECYEVVQFVNGRFKQPISVRIYATAQKTFCCIWVYHNKYRTSGSGISEGYGFHRSSEAVEFAFQAAGIKLDTDINGAGDGALKEAIETLAIYIGCKKFTIVNGHG